MGEFLRRTAKLFFLYLVAGLVAFGLALADGYSMGVSIASGVTAAVLMFMLITMLFWRP